jgi:UDP-4-amino-4,6-dideoxy-N-acetyl-beta-L-altrosamine transaminase
LSRFIPYGRQDINDDDIRAVTQALRGDLITQGPLVKEFEDRLAEYCGARFVVAFSSGTAALQGACYAAGLTQGDELITSPVTFAATANAAMYVGARPIFVDVEADTGNIDCAQIEKHITPKSRAIAPVHFAGHPVDLDLIYEVADRKGLVVIQDACHALGARYKGRKIGSFPGMTAFSFHPLKPITTGEGGAVATDSKEFFDKMVDLRSHGVTRDRERFRDEPHGAWYYEMQSLGYNYRITDIQCALGISQLKRLDAFVERREKIAKGYDGAFKGNPWFDVPPVRDYARRGLHLYHIRLKDDIKKKRAEVFDSLRSRGLGVQVHYIPVYFHPYYQELGYEKGACPQAEDFYWREISLPIYPAMTDNDIHAVVETVCKVFTELV